MKAEVLKAIEVMEYANTPIDEEEAWGIIKSELTSLQSRADRAEALLIRAKEHVFGWTLHDDISEFLAEREG